MSEAAGLAVGRTPAPRRGGLLRADLVVPLVLFGLLAAAPFVTAQGYILSLLSRVTILGLAALSLDLILGYGAMVSFGHAAFLGIGAYTVGILWSHGIADLSVQVPVALLASAAFALVTGAISLRTQGVYFIMITLAFGQMLFFLATSLAPYGGDDGLTLSGRSTLFGFAVLRGEVALYGVSLACLAGVYAGLRTVVASRFGRVLRGCRENPVRMEAIGFHPFRYRLVAYVLSGTIAGLAGVLLANQADFVSPALMSWQRSGDLIFMVVLGGAGTLHGAILGSGAFLLVEEVLSEWTVNWRLIFGPLLVLAVIFMRGGIAGLFGRMRRRTHHG